MVPAAVSAMSTIIREPIADLSRALLDYEGTHPRVWVYWNELQYVSGSMFRITSEYMHRGQVHYTCGLPLRMDDTRFMTIDAKGRYLIGEFPKDSLITNIKVDGHGLGSGGVKLKMEVEYV